jgi:cell division protein FtsN
MTDTDRDGQNREGLGLDDPERLPWLETADGYEYEESASPLKVAGLVLGGLALLAAIVGGIYWLQRNQAGGQGNGELIAAQEGEYKVPPTDPQGKKFEGEGDAAFAASEGKKVDTKLDPAKAKAAAPAPAPAPAAAGAPAAKAGPIPAGAAFVQLGAFSDAAKAEQAWTALGKRFGAISGTNKRVTEGAGEGGRKVFRLQAIAANSAAAQQLCAKLKAAGENCIVVR